MLTILLHSSKTMQTATKPTAYQKPALLSSAEQLVHYIQTLKTKELGAAMHVSASMADKTHATFTDWSTNESFQLPAIDAFLGDIYSGLQVNTFTVDDRTYANKHLYILSGLYGILRALDSIAPYRLEMGYHLPDDTYRNLYTYWGTSIGDQLPITNDIINLAAVEYTKAINQYPEGVRVISPKFLTLDPRTGETKFVVVHAKIARGAFARWLIIERIQTVEDIIQFSDLGYMYYPALSTFHEPVFVCQSFGGIGLSVRLSN